MSGRRVLVGTVVSDKMNKTIVVAVSRVKRHPLYKKAIKRTRRFKAHDEENTARLGDRVRIEESRPLSREKRWRLLEVVTRGELAEVAPKEIDAELLGERPAAAVEEGAE